MPDHTFHPSVGHHNTGNSVAPAAGIAAAGPAAIWAVPEAAADRFAAIPGVPYFCRSYCIPPGLVYEKNRKNVRFGPSISRSFVL